MSSRNHLKTAEGLRRLPKKFFNLSEKATRFPQFAGSIQPYVSIRFANGRILDCRTSAVPFDEIGRFDSFAASSYVVDEITAAESEQRARGARVPDLNWVRMARAKRTRRQWHLTDKEREAIALDLFARTRKPIPVLKPKPLKAGRGVPQLSAHREGSFWWRYWWRFAT
jgi:hypothetical protein